MVKLQRAEVEQFVKQVLTDAVKEAGGIVRGAHALYLPDPGPNVYVDIRLVPSYMSSAVSSVQVELRGRTYGRNRGAVIFRNGNAPDDWREKVRAKIDEMVGLAKGYAARAEREVEERKVRDREVAKVVARTADQAREAGFEVSTSGDGTRMLARKGEVEVRVSASGVEVRVEMEYGVEKAEEAVLVALDMYKAVRRVDRGFTPPDDLD